MNTVLRWSLAFLFTAGLVATDLPAQLRAIDTKQSTMTIRVGKAGVFSVFGHEHEIGCVIDSGSVEMGAQPAVEVRVDARTLRVIDKDESEATRAEVQGTMLGPEVLDSERFSEIVFRSTSTETAGEGKWTVQGNLTLHGQTKPATVQVTLKGNRYTGEAVVKQTDFGIKPPGKAGVRARDEVRIEFDIRLAP